MTECKVWQGGLDKEGYAITTKFHKQKRVHRLIWEEAYGATQKAVCHKCNNKACINILHLYIATPAENSTHAAQDDLYRRKYSKQVIADVLSGSFTAKQLQEMHGISDSYVSQLRSGKRNPVYCKAKDWPLRGAI